MKKFARCAKCDTPLTGYLNQRKQLWYYKCNTKGCGVNVNALQMNEAFVDVVQHYTLDPLLIEPLKAQLRLTFDGLNQERSKTLVALNAKLKESEEKIDRLQERFAFGHIPSDVYSKFIAPCNEEKRNIESEIEKVNCQLSNAAKYIDFSLQLAVNLKETWFTSSTEQKQKLQYLLFPAGVKFDKTERKYLTIKVNAVFSWMSRLSRVSVKKESGQIDCNIDLSALVERTGIEPVFHP